MSEFVSNTRLSRSYLYNLMAGRVADPGVKTLFSLAKALDLPCIAMFRLFRGQNNAPVCLSEIHTAMSNMDDCCMFADDTSHPDYAMVLPGEAFTKTWAIQNVGKVNWKSRRLQRIDKEIIFTTRQSADTTSELTNTHLHSSHSSVAIPDCAPGDTIQIAAQFVAPMGHASVASLWRPVDSHGIYIYARDFYLQAVVTVVGD